MLESRFLVVVNLGTMFLENKEYTKVKKEGCYSEREALRKANRFRREGPVKIMRNYKKKYKEVLSFPKKEA